MPDGKCQNHPEIVLLISSSAMPLFPPDPPSPTWNSEAEPPPEPLESDDGNERFHGKMTNKISDAPASPLQMRFDFDAAPPPAASPAAGRTSSVSTPRRSRSCHPAFSSRERALISIFGGILTLAPPLLTSGSGDSSPAARRRANKAPLCKQTSEASAPLRQCATHFAICHLPLFARAFVVSEVSRMRHPRQGAPQ